MVFNAQPANERDNGDNEAQNERFKAALRQVLGDTLKKPIGVRLGFLNDNGEAFLEVPRQRSDEPQKYYFHEGGGTTFQGEAFLQPGALPNWMIRFGTPVQIKKDPLSREWEIIALDSRYGAQYFIGTDNDDGVFIPYNKIAPGMLTQTVPASMKARVLEAAYSSNGALRWYQAQETVDWSVAPYSANVPTTNLRQVFTLVQIAYSTGILSYKYGLQVPSSWSNQQAYDANLTAGDDSILPSVDPDNFRSGYVKLIAGMTRITRSDNIWAIQDYLSLGGSGGKEAILDSIVTDPLDGSVVVDPVTGNVVFV